MSDDVSMLLDQVSAAETSECRDWQKIDFYTNFQIAVESYKKLCDNSLWVMIWRKEQREWSWKKEKMKKWEKNEQQLKSEKLKKKKIKE